MSVSYNKILQKERLKRRKLSFQLVLIALVIVVCAYVSELFDGQRLIAGVPSLLLIFSESIPPDFSDWQSWLRPLFDTLAMSIAGTALAMLVAVPLGVLAARNTTPHVLVYQLVRGMLNLLRSIPELIMGILFVAAVGFGVLPGVLALAFHSIGMVGKFIAETIEHADPGVIEAIRATGASSFQVMIHGVLSQVIPQICDVTLYRWEYNFRASTVMGMVGAGGIGFELMSALRLMNYDEVSAILLLILLLVTLVDSLGASLREKMK
ncbi:MAG: phosphonate ABC transporter, permease protein PhnE [Gammaproteobacteria bacterium]|nr:phosphonate ABC transporter, permease protein PhnE [Gammaproteobacteria bacterium]